MTAIFASPQLPALTFDFILQRRGKEELDKSRGLQAAASSSSIINVTVRTWLLSRSFAVAASMEDEEAAALV